MRKPFAYVLALTGCFLFLGGSGGLSAASTRSAARGDLAAIKTKEDLELRKLEEEILNLRLENEANRKPYWLVTLAGFEGPITVAISFIGVFLAMWKFFAEQKKAKAEVARRLKEEREERAKERAREFDAKFIAIIPGLFSPDKNIRLGAIATIHTLLPSDGLKYHKEILDGVISCLRRESDSETRKLLVAGFNKLIKCYPYKTGTQIPPSAGTVKIPEFDLSYLTMSGSVLDGLDLTFVDFAHSKITGSSFINALLIKGRCVNAEFSLSNFESANLKEAGCFRAKFDGANFRNAILTGVNFREASLVKADFTRAKLQSARLFRANITGASFEGADVNDNFLVTNAFDQVAARSILRALNPEKAHFSKKLLNVIRDSKPGFEPRSVHKIK